MSKKRQIQVALAVTNDIVADRRVLRHCNTLQKMGCTVSVFGVDRGKEKSDFSFFSYYKPTHCRGWRFYWEYNDHMRKALVQKRPDVIWANDVDTVVGCYAAAHRLHCPIVLDLHEIMSEVPEVQGRKIVQWVWRKIEGFYIKRCDAVMTVCHSLANFFGERYGVNITVVRNLPPMTEAPDIKKQKDNINNPITLIYQGAVNKGRGVDWAVQMMKDLPQCRLLIVGDGDEYNHIKEIVNDSPAKENIIIYGRVRTEALDNITAQADIGLVMLQDIGLSYRYALPNRIGDFIRAGIPMIVSQREEMVQVVKRYGIGKVIEGEGSGALKRCVVDTIEWWNSLDDNERQKRFEKARGEMCWEKEQEKLKEVTQKIGI